MEDKENIDFGIYYRRLEMNKKSFEYNPEIVIDENSFYIKKETRIYLYSIGIKRVFTATDKIFYWLYNNDLISCINLIENKDLVEKNHLVGNIGDEGIVSTGKIIEVEHGKKKEIIETNINGTTVTEIKEIKNEFMFEYENVQYIEKANDGKYVILKSDGTWKYLE